MSCAFNLDQFQITGKRSHGNHIGQTKKTPNNKKHLLGPYHMSSFTDISILTQALPLAYKRGKWSSELSNITQTHHLLRVQLEFKNFVSGASKPVPSLVSASASFPMLAPQLCFCRSCKALLWRRSPWSFSSVHCHNSLCLWFSTYLIFLEVSMCFWEIFPGQS